MNAQRIQSILQSIRALPHEAVQYETTRDGSVEDANVLAWDSAGLQQLRALAAEITSDVANVPLQGPYAIAEWIRANIRYTQERFGIEVLQGPVSTLKTMTGDCDDLVILWAALCVSIGLRAYLVGVGMRDATSQWYVHAIGYAPDTELELYELTQDSRYGGGGFCIEEPYLPPNSFLVYYEPDTDAMVQLAADAQGAAPARKRGFPWLGVGAAALLAVWVSRK